MLALDQQALERRSLARNEALFRQGDKVTAIYFIETGRLRLDRRTFYGRTLIVGTAPAGEFFLPTSSIATPWRLNLHGSASIPRPQFSPPSARIRQAPCRSWRLCLIKSSRFGSILS